MASSGIQITCLGALEYDKNVRLILGWFMSRSEQNLGGRHPRLFQICDIISASSVSDLRDMFTTAIDKIWRLDYVELRGLLNLRVDLDGKDEELETFLEWVESFL